MQIKLAGWNFDLDQQQFLREHSNNDLFCFVAIYSNFQLKSWLSRLVIVIKSCFVLIIQNFVYFLSSKWSVLDCIVSILIHSFIYNFLPFQSIIACFSKIDQTCWSVPGHPQSTDEYGRSRVSSDNTRWLNLWWILSRYLASYLLLAL